MKHKSESEMQPDLKCGSFTMRTGHMETAIVLVV